MSKIVRLSENDLVRLVKKVIKEQQEPSTPKATKGPFATHKDVGGWYDAADRNVNEPTDYSEEREFGPDEYDNFMEYINNCDTRWCIKTKNMYDLYAQRGSIKVRK